MTENLSGVPVIYPVSVPAEYHLLEPDFYFSCFRFLKMLSQFDYIDVITYSYSYNDSSIKVRRLITGIPPEVSIPPKTQHKVSKGMHSKVYLCYMCSRLHSVFAGSFNLAHSTNSNVILRVRGDKARRMFVKYFTYWWNHPKQ